MANYVSVTSFLKRHKNLESRISLNSKKVLKYLKKNNLALEVFLVSDKRIKTLNAKFRGKNRSTNVLSFELKNWPAFDFRNKKLKAIGEVFLATDYIARKKENLERMLVHGILHLLGYDHQKKGDSIRMEKIEQKLIQRLKSRFLR